MKNANSRFVRVLAIVLVVLMVVPAALVGCGSNKANNAAISEALAAAEAARKEAEEAKAAADAAAAEAAAKAAEEAAKLLEEANKKAEEALKAAEDAKKELEEAKKTTAAPVTQAPASTEDMKVVADYAYQMLNNKELDFVKTYLMYAYGATEEDLEDASESQIKLLLTYDPIITDEANPVYAEDDVKAMVALYDAAKVAIYQANTVDYINTVVANFVAAIKATPTYVEKVIAAYEAIDFASKYDVIDVVYAYALLEEALADFEEIADADLKADLMEQLNKHGEDEIDVEEAINNEYYRYTGLDSVAANKTVVEEDDILYKDMYADAQKVIAAVQIVFGGSDLDLANIVYATDIDDKLEDATEAYAKWNNKYFVKADDTELVKYYEAFRQAFVGEEYVLDEDNDYAWEATVAAGARVEELLAAAKEAEDLIKMIKSIANLNTAIDNKEFKYAKHVKKVADAEAALDAWKAKYNFKDDAEGNEDDNVKAIIDAKAAIYENYKDNALVIKYFDYLEKTASAVNVDAFIDASEEKLNGTDYNFNFKKYGAAVAAALEWYFGKLKADGVTYVGGFKNIKVQDQKGFAGLVETADNKEDAEPYDVAKLIEINNVSIMAILDNLFDVDDVPTLFEAMDDSYNALVAKKKVADGINEDIEELVEMGATLKVLVGLSEIFDADFEKFAEADDEDKDDILVNSCDIKDWATGVITIGDENFNNLIDWAALETVYKNYKASLATVIADSAEVALEYIAWQAAVGTGDAKYIEDDEQIEFTYGGTKYTFSDLNPAQIDVYSYDRIKNVIALEKTLEDLFDSDNEKIVETLQKISADIPDDENELDIVLTKIISYCNAMVAEFYDNVAKPVGDFATGIITGYPVLGAANKAKYNDWKSTVNAAGTKMTEDLVYDNYAFYDRSWGSDADAIVVEKLVKAVKEVLAKFKNASLVGYGDAIDTDSDTAFTEISFQGAIYSVDPRDYASKNSDGKYTGEFDAKAYRAALNAAVADTYTKYLDAYVKDVAQQSDFTAMINSISGNALKYGLWTVEGDFEIDDEVYTYTVNSTGKDYVLAIYDSSDEKMENNAVPFKYDNVPYIVGFTARLIDGKLELVPALLPSVEVEGEEDLQIPGLPVGKTIYDLIDVKKEDLTHDVRDYAEEIGANFATVKTVAIGTGAVYATLTAEQLKAIFDAEAKNDFYATFEALRNRMYTPSSATNTAWKALGTYIDSSLDISAVADKITVISKLARDSVYAMTPEANTIADIEKEFNKYATRVKAVLAEAGLVEGEDYYENIWVKVVTTEIIEGDNPDTEEVETEWTKETVSYEKGDVVYLGAEDIDEAAAQ